MALDDRQHRTRLRVWTDGRGGPGTTYRLELLPWLDEHGGPYAAAGPDMFEALVRLRRQLEPEGWAIAVQGARRDAYPSGMARDMGGGFRTYLLRPGRKASVSDLVDTLADAPVALLATVDEQRAFFEAWLREPRKV